MENGMNYMRKTTHDVVTVCDVCKEIFSFNYKAWGAAYEEFNECCCICEEKVVTTLQ